MFENLYHRKNIVWATLEGTQKRLVQAPNRFLTKLEAQLKKELDEVLSQIELLWFQNHVRMLFGIETVIHDITILVPSYEDGLIILSPFRTPMGIGYGKSKSFRTWYVISSCNYTLTTMGHISRISSLIIGFLE